MMNLPPRPLALVALLKSTWTEALHMRFEIPKNYLGDASNELAISAI